MILVKIYETKGNLVFECYNRLINNVLYPNEIIDDKPTNKVQIIGAKYVVISPEAKKLLIYAFNNAVCTNGDSDFMIYQLKNRKTVFSWRGANKQVIDIKNIKKYDINTTCGLPDLSLIEYFKVEKNELLAKQSLEQINWTYKYNQCINSHGFSLN